MRITPKTEDEIARDGLLPAGDYDFTVLKAEDAVSKKSGNEMIKVQLGVYDADGRMQYVTDYLMEAMEAKLFGFFRTVGKLDLYNSGEFAAADLEDLSGRVKIIIKEDKSGQYPPKNEVRAYLKPADGQEQAPAQRRPAPPKSTPAEEADDDIPF